MLRVSVVVLLLAGILLAAGPAIQAQPVGKVRVDYVPTGVPQHMNLQGYLTDSLGTPVTDTLPMMFKIWRDGSAVWTETQNNCVILSGLFSVGLGTVTPIPFSVFEPGTVCSLEVTVDSTVLPKVEITSVGFAYRSVKSDTAIYAQSSAGGPPSGPADGDLAGTYPNPSVDGLQGRAVAGTAPGTNQVLTWNGSTWTPSDVSITRPISPPLSGSEIAKPCTLAMAGAWPEAPLAVRNDSNGPAIVLSGEGTGIYASDLHANVIEVTNGQNIMQLGSVRALINCDYNDYDAINLDSCHRDGISARARDVAGNFTSLDNSDPAIVTRAYQNTSTLTAIRAYGTGVASGGWSTGYLKGPQKEAPCVVSTDRSILAFGTAVIEKGEVRVSLPDVLVQNSTEGGPIHVTVTPVGVPSGVLYVSQVNDTGFEVAVASVPSLAGPDNTTFNWTAICRLDVPAQGDEAKADLAEQARKLAERRRERRESVGRWSK